MTEQLATNDVFLPRGCAPLKGRSLRRPQGVPQWALRGASSQAASTVSDFATALVIVNPWVHWPRARHILHSAGVGKSRDHALDAQGTPYQSDFIMPPRSTAAR